MDTAILFVSLMKRKPNIESISDVDIDIRAQTGRKEETCTDLHIQGGDLAIPTLALEHIRHHAGGPNPNLMFGIGKYCEHRLCLRGSQEYYDNEYGAITGYADPWHDHTDWYGSRDGEELYLDLDAKPEGWSDGEEVNDYPADQLTKQPKKKTNDNTVSSCKERGGFIIAKLLMSSYSLLLVMHISYHSYQALQLPAL